MTGTKTPYRYPDLAATWRSARRATSAFLLERAPVMQHLLPLGLSNRALIKEARRAPIYAHPRERAMFETSMRAAAFYDALKALEHAAEALESSIVELTEITRQTDEQEEKDLDADRGA